MKKTTAALLAALLLMTVFFTGTCSASDNTVKGSVTCTTMRDVAAFLFDAGSGELVFGPAVLNENGEKKEVYAISINGMCNDLHKKNNPIASVLSAFNLPTKYRKMVKSAILENIPTGSSLIFMGHSLGGMIAQQLICDSELTAAYEILHTVTIGSPYIMTSASKREGTLTRLADTSDKVPHMTPAILFSRKNFKAMTLEDGGYNGDADGAHNRSFSDADIWLKYDVLGIKGGNSSFTYEDALLISFVA